MITRMLVLLKTQALLCQTCKQLAYKNRLLTHRSITNIAQLACVANTEASKVTDIQTKLVCAHRTTAHSYFFDNKPAISLCNATIIHTSRRNGVCDNLETTTFEQLAHNGTNLNLQNFSDKNFYSNKHYICRSIYNKTLSDVSVISKPASIYHAKYQQYYRKEFIHRSQLFSSFDGGISTSNILQNRNISPMKQTCCMFHTSTGDKLLYNMDQDKLDVNLFPPWKIMFFGTDEIALFTLKALYENM